MSTYWLKFISLANNTGLSVAHIAKGEATCKNPMNDYIS